MTDRARSVGDRAASEIDTPGPRLTPTCGGRTRRPRTEERPLPDDHPRRVCQLGALDPRCPITEKGLDATRAAGTEREAPLAAALLAEAYLKAGQAGEGLKVLDEPVGRLARTAEGWIGGGAAPGKGPAADGAASPRFR
jgi:hypothetical protein